MAAVTIDAKEIEKALVQIAEKVAQALAWIQGKSGRIPLDIPEPYDHAVIKPASRSCNPVAADSCGEIAILLGAMAKGRKRKRSKT